MAENAASAVETGSGEGAKHVPREGMGLHTLLGQSLEGLSAVLGGIAQGWFWGAAAELD